MSNDNFYALKSFLSLVLLAVVFPLAAQTDDERPTTYAQDAAIFGRVTRGGTARSVGIGNATTALGGDMGVTTTNPAGLGFYRKSEFNFTPVFGVSGGSGSYLGNKDSDSKGYFAINNMGIVIGMGTANDKGYKGGALSFGMNRVNNFQNKVSFSGANSKNNFGDYITELSEGRHASELQGNFQAGTINDLPTLGYASFLINPYDGASFPNDTTYHTYYESETVMQKGALTTKGAQYNWYAAYGGNINDKVYFGFSFNMSTLKNDKNYAYNETVGKVTAGTFTAKADTLIDFTYYNNLKTTGTGISFSGGLVWKVSKGIRMGASIASPTFYTMKDAHTEQVNVNYVPIPIPNVPGLYSLQANYNYSTNQSLFKYNYRSPMHASGGIAMFIGKKGFITGDVEVVPYASSKYSAKDNTINTLKFDQDNKTIKSTYKTAFNFRGGAEFRAKSLMLRGGFGFIGDPYKAAEGAKPNNMMQFSAGFGLRGDTQYLDFTLVNTRSTGNYNPYVLDNGSQPTVTFNHTTYSLVISGGLYF